ncbi:hypothetical protein [Hymenobacter sp. BT190]|uniref:hypothetical protein n=1 Tax=Hymenobacter sp. BT190 TaxID=2763505 RepID=UPI00165113E1|nr:hypothetical protein [Hymenobacter sp. BT190]MBC6698311.1 hypothetical protein [Hymenobacter sp. BT190]
MDDKLFPDWLLERLSTFSFDWESTKTIVASQLLKQITLHDSSLFRIFLHTKDSLIMIFEVDAIWNPDFCHSKTDWPFLIAEFQHTISVVQDFSDDEPVVSIVGEAKSTTIDSEEYSSWLSIGESIGIYDALDLPIHKHLQTYSTQISTVYGGNLACVHKGPIRILLYSQIGDLLPITIPD